MNSSVAAGGGGWKPPFTASQWEELEHQALVFKYLVAGVPVPPELLLHIRKSMESSAARFHRHSTSYRSDGKKMDPEPWRCRRTDGKKWRCSKQAYPDSRYCERHMHRGRARSRKHVETQSFSQLQSSTSSPSSTVTTLAPSGGSTSVGSGSGSGSVRSFPSSISLQSFGSGGGNSATQLSFTGSSLSQLQVDPGYYGMGCAGYREESTMDGRNFLSEASGSTGALSINFSLDNIWRQMPSEVACYLSKPNNGSLLQGSYPQPQSIQDFGHEIISLLSTQEQQQQQQQHCLSVSEFGSSEPAKQESQPLRSFFDEWPDTRDSLSDLEDDRSNRTSFSATQLSISLPMASSDFSTTSSRSPSGDD